MNDKKNPKVEWGYFAVTPRILRTQYKQLSHTEKWLYTCLKDLCGDKGMCYRALRVLAQETDLSIGNLSTGIRHLHEAGLIHAEKKRRSNNPTAKEVWHISIVDIWQTNVEYCSNYEHSAENVQIMNNDVQIMNEVALKRSYSEQKRSNFVARRNNTEEQHSEEITGEEQQEVASQNFDATAHAFSENENDFHFDEDDDTPTEKTPIVTIGATTDGDTAGTDIRSHRATSHTPGSDSHDALQDVRAAAGHPQRTSQTEQQVAIASIPGEAADPPIAAKTRQSKNDGATTVTASEPRPSGKRKKVTQAPPELSPEVTRILDDWDSLHKKPVPRIEANITAAQLLVAAQTNREEMKGCRDWLPTTDRPGKPWYRKIGVHLPDIAAKLEQYRSLADMPPETRAPLADKARKNVLDAQYEAALEKTGQPLEQEEVPAWLDFDNYVGNGPEARQRLVERGLELKAQGFCPDL